MVWLSTNSLPLLRRDDTIGAAPLHLCYFGCPTPFSIINLPKAYALDALVQSRLPIDWKAPQIHELFLIDTSSSMVCDILPSLLQNI